MLTRNGNQAWETLSYGYFRDFVKILNNDFVFIWLKNNKNSTEILKMGKGSKSQLLIWVPVSWATGIVIFLPSRYVL